MHSPFGNGAHGGDAVRVETFRDLSILRSLQAAVRCHGNRAGARARADGSAAMEGTSVPIRGEQAGEARSPWMAGRDHSAGETVAAFRTYALVLVAATVLHLLFAASLPVSGDEAYLWDCSRHPDWSYFDQPPLIIWGIALSRALLGDGALAVRWPAILSSLLIGVFLLPLVRRLGGGPREAATAYLLMHAMPVFFFGFFYSSTDIAMAPWFLAAVWAAAAL